MPRVAPLVFLFAWTRVTIPTEKDAAFNVAVQASQEEAWARSANASWNFLLAADPEDPRYDRGLRLLARSAEGMELNWAAGMIYREIAQTRRSPELIDDALLGIERVVRGGAYDEDILLTSFVAAEQFGYLPVEVQAFVDYHQGLDLTRRGEDAWADVIFERIAPETHYYWETRYVVAVRHVADGEYPEAIAELKGMLEVADQLEVDLLTRVHRSLARLAFDELRFEDALSHYEQIRDQAASDPEILLEMAWTHFYLGDSRKSLGLLRALDAPVHEAYVSPERYLLEAHALRRLCQFDAARGALLRLQSRYGESLDALATGTMPIDIPQLVGTARIRGHSRQNAELISRIDREITVLTGLQISRSLRTHLLGLYTRGLTESRRREAALIGPDVDDLADELLAVEEGVTLIIHELAVSMLRGRRRPAGVAEKPQLQIPLSGENVAYALQGEFWTDELDDLVVLAEDRCIE